MFYAFSIRKGIFMEMEDPGQEFKVYSGSLPDLLGNLSPKKGPSRPKKDEPLPRKDRPVPRKDGPPQERTEPSYKRTGLPKKGRARPKKGRASQKRTGPSQERTGLPKRPESRPLPDLELPQGPAHGFLDLLVDLLGREPGGRRRRRCRRLHVPEERPDRPEGFGGRLRAAGIGQLEEFPRLQPHGSGDREDVLHLELDRAGEDAADVAGREPEPPLDLPVGQAEQADGRAEDVQQPVDFLFVTHTERVLQTGNLAQGARNSPRSTRMSFLS